MSKKDKVKTEKADNKTSDVLNKDDNNTAEANEVCDDKASEDKTETASEKEADKACEDASQTSDEDTDKSSESKDKDKASDSKKKDPKDAVIEDLQDRLKRQMAEFDNFRKRTEKEKSAMFEMGASDIIKKLLPIVDNFERGFKSVSEDDLEDAFVKGMNMVLKQTMKMLDDTGVKPIEAVGCEFNPEYHNAVMHVDDDSVGDNIIVEEFEKGYIYRDTVIRHSMVKVAN